MEICVLCTRRKHLEIENGAPFWRNSQLTKFAQYHFRLMAVMNCPEITWLFLVQNIAEFGAGLLFKLFHCIRDSINENPSQVKWNCVRKHSILIKRFCLVNKMNNHIRSLILLLVCQCFLVADCNPDAKRLYDDLLSTYNRLIRPVSNNTETVLVKLGLRLSQLIDLVSWFFTIDFVQILWKESQLLPPTYTMNACKTNQSLRSYAYPEIIT